jgi:EAL domain-containing protein (putative c-di-GMP-specific phosphodiesterase class I)/GGDEF domain-containing protein
MDGGTVTKAAPLSHPELLAELGSALSGSNGSFALLFIDISDFPTLQARLGFEVSSVLVESLFAYFTAALGERGTVLRFGDARFCILVNAIRNRGHALLAAEKITRAADEAMNNAAVTLAPDLTIGIALYPLQAADADSLLRKAQLAGASVRKHHKRINVFDDSCMIHVLTPWELSNTFAQALRSGQLQVYYQPKLRIADGRTIGVEALMRWLKDNRPVATPDVFIPLAEDAGLIEDTTWFVLSNALQEAARWGDLSVAVNITPSMLHHRDFVEMVRSAMSTWNVKSGGLTLEITEGALIADFLEASARLGRLRDLGVHISIDDFGTGYSSLSYFKKIPADELKIDKSFVLRMLADESDQRLVKTIINLAHQFSLKVVAEGVETQGALAMLVDMGCDYAQGYLFAPALHKDQLQAWLQSRNGPP